MQWILRFRVCIIICLAVVLISAAVIFSALRAVLPYATGYKNEIQQEISQQIGLPVEIKSIDAAIHWFSPRLRLIDVSVYDEKKKIPLINLREAFVELDVMASLLRREIIVADIGLVGADLSIEKLSENEWQVQGVKFSSEGSSELPEQFIYMLQNANYLLHDCNIYYTDNTQKDFSLSLLDVNMDVENSFNNHEIKFSMNLPKHIGKSLVVVANLQGDIDSLDGEIYIEAKQINVEQLNKKFSFIKDYQLASILDLNLWASIDDNDIQSLIAQLAASKLKVRNTVTRKTWSSNYLSANIRYVTDDERWSLTVDDFYFGEKNRPAWEQTVTILASDDDQHYYLSSDYLHFSDVQKIASAILMPEQLKQLKQLNTYQIQADLYNFSLQLPKDITPENLMEELYIDATINNFSARDEVNNITVSGLDLSLLYDNDEVVIDLATAGAKFEMNNIFRNPLHADILRGEIRLKHSEAGWSGSTEKLQLKNNHINVLSRFDLKILPDNKLFVDLQADFYDGFGKYAMYYLPVGVMQPELVTWLEMAITDGYVPSGSMILHGRLDDFPFDKHDGIFQVLFSPRDIEMKFLEGWPLLTEVSGIVKFNNQSLVVREAKGKTQAVQLLNGYAEIKKLPDPHLTVVTDAHANNEDVQAYVWDSPLDDVLGNALRLFQLDGSSDLKLTLEVPLNKETVDVEIDGRLSFIDTDFYYPELGYEMSAVNGTIQFTEDSIFADSMVAVVNKKPVSINAFTRNGDAGNEVIFHLDGVIAADYLLQRYDWVPKSWIKGDSDWSMDFEIPYEPKDYLVRIHANSYLQDVVLSVSDKVHKAADKKLSFSTQIDILDESGLRMNATISDQSGADMFDLFAARNGKDLWSFDIRSRYMSGKGEFTEGLGKDTVLKLDLDEIDIHSLFVTEKETGGQALKPVDFPPLDWKAKTVIWKDWTFNNVVLETDWHKHGMLINTLSLDGPAMKFESRGTWLTTWRGKYVTVLQGNLTSSNFGETLTGLGYQRSIDRAAYEASFNAQWPAEPYALSWSNVEGKTSFKMENGEILEVEPGATGRLLGLLNIFKLTNRLAFDFDDVYRDGFAFDFIEGEFEFVNGDGSLKNFDVSAPAADINMFGSIGMVKQDYGLLMRVKPHTDTLTFAGGALLGGVAVGAGLALIQKVFDISIIGHNVYSITGSWDEPVIEKISSKIDESDSADEDDF